MKLTKALNNSLYFIALIAQSANAIIGGSDASANDAPFTVAIILSSPFGETYICAGSLISPKTVLTTAGCVDGSTAGYLRARVGSLEHAAGGKVVQVVEVIKHPNYNTNTRDADFAILHLANAVMNIKPVAVAEKATLSAAPVVLYGWGLTDKEAKEPPRTLQRLETTFITADDCDPKWSDFTVITRNMNCDAAPEKQKGSCSKDQGGPVVNSSGELVGLMGYYNYCEPHSDGRPDVNNDPLSVSDWIAHNTV